MSVGDGCPDTGDTDSDQNDVGHHAHGDHCGGVASRHPLAQHVRVLSSDGDDQGSPGQEPGTERNEHAFHAKARSGTVQRKILQYLKLCFTELVRFHPAQLETLLAIAEDGSFEAAARRLHLTPSAVSQRIRALESAAGQVLVRRTTPAEITDAGAPLLRLAQQLRMLTAEAGAELGHDDVVELRVAVNADSLATWFRPVLSAIGRLRNTALQLAVEDEGHSHELLRRGEVLAAVTKEPRPVQGCNVEFLGSLRYRAAASPELLAEHQHGADVDWSAMPMLVFNEKDRLQDTVLAAHQASRPRVIHRVPSSADFFEAVRAGLGWGLIPVPQLVPALQHGDLVCIPGTGPVDVDLFWQRWRLRSPALDTLTDMVKAAARSEMHRQEDSA